jgi:hypothetical protein
MKHGFNPWVVVTVALVSVVGCGVFYVYQQNAAQRERDAVTLRNFDAVQHYNSNAAPIVPFPQPPPKKVMPV